MRTRLRKLSAFLGREAFPGKPLPIRALLIFARTLFFAAKKFRRDLCFERAAALAFIAILSLIPVGFLFLFFTRSFGLLKSWEKIKVGILDNFVPESREAIARWLGEFERDWDASVGSAPYYVLVIGALIFSALWLFEASETALSRIWGVTRSRSFVQRVTVFWLMVTASPFLLAASSFIKAQFEGSPTIRGLMTQSVLFETFYGYFVPVAVATLGFFFVYLLLPATRVRVLPALAAAILAAICWQGAKEALAYFVPRAVTTDIYGSLGAIAAFFLWFYVSWLTLLYGAQVSFVAQYPREAIEKLLVHDEPERLPPGALALVMAVELAKAQSDEAPPPPLSEVARPWRVADEALRREVLAYSPQVFHRSAGDEEVYYLSRDSDKILVSELLASGKRTEQSPLPPNPVEDFLGAVERSLEAALVGISVRDVMNRNVSLRPPAAS